MNFTPHGVSRTRQQQPFSCLSGKSGVGRGNFFFCAREVFFLHCVAISSAADGNVEMGTPDVIQPLAKINESE